MRGLLITFEGVEGSGKTTQALRLVEYLKGREFPVVFSREPGGTQIGERIREILLDPESKGMHRLTELFLYLASRNQHTREKILPALQSGSIVVLDRYADSSVAYQGYGRELGEKLVSRLNKLATAGLKPDLTIVIDLPVAVGQQRKADGSPDRLEQELLEFHERVRTGYLKLARRAAGRCKLVNGDQPEDQVALRIRELVEDFLIRKGVVRT
ncbi:MAG: dTMP kinase [candidate division WOR-3 bacterium]